MINTSSIPYGLLLREEIEISLDALNNVITEVLIYGSDEDIVGDRFASISNKELVMFLASAEMVQTLAYLALAALSTRGQGEVVAAGATLAKEANERLAKSQGS